jgi:hypothetical protein
MFIVKLTSFYVAQKIDDFWKFGEVLEDFAGIIGTDGASDANGPNEDNVNNDQIFPNQP